MCEVIAQPRNLTKAQLAEKPSLYLAGPFGKPGTRDDTWRDDIITAFQHDDVYVFDPRNAEAWARVTADEPGNGAFHGFVDWQLRNSRNADVFVCWLPVGATAALGLLQLGVVAGKRGGAAKGSTVIVGCPDRGAHQGLALSFGRHMNIAVMAGLDTVITCARHELSKLQKKKKQA